ncbi:hypothetical protein CMUS01_01315 [Colletotrichum musicola]|uniref:Uncharacterized protein n=1 Tax=Colletotrichum musicola TaxID=2175873 RepID=A0A8H6U8V9_9PEZI|nr:hypothetical protein CMUS01_01315 [Colletotrichum musicola]
MAKAAFLIPVSVAISQTQWSWFSHGNKTSHSRPLYDLDVIDQASRCAWGAFLLLWRFRFQHIIVLGALLVTVSALTSPITQLAVNLYMQDVVVGGEYADTQVVRDLRLLRDEVVQATRQAGFQATFLDYTSFREALPYTTFSTEGLFCSTGNCAFNQYHSLAVCIKVANISSQLSRKSFKYPGMVNTTLIGPEANRTIWTASLPNGHELSRQSKLTMFADLLNGNVTFGFQNDTTLQQARIASFVSIYTTPIIHNMTWWSSLGETEFSFEEALNNIDDFRHDATEVLFHLCVNTYETEVRKGVETTRVVSSSTVPLEETGRPFVDLDCDTPLVDGTYSCLQRKDRWNETLDLESPGDSSSDPQTSGEGFSADYGAMEGIARSMRFYMAGYVSFTKVPDKRKGFTLEQYGGEFVLNLHQVVFFGPHTMPNPDLRQTFLRNIYQNVATSLTALLRAGRPGMQRFVDGVFNVTGTASRDIPDVRIKWPWVSLLAVEIAVAALFLALTIAEQAGGQGSRFRDLKSSSLATLVALSADCRAAAGGGLGPVGELERIAKTLDVRLEGAHIVLAEKAADEKSL